MERQKRHGDVENMAGDGLSAGGTACQGGGRHIRHKVQKEKISKKPGAAERRRHVQELLDCLSPDQGNWSDPRLTHNKKPGKEGRQRGDRCSLL